jgi:hypothetical protein
MVLQQVYTILRAMVMVPTVQSFILWVVDGAQDLTIHLYLKTVTSGLSQMLDPHHQMFQILGLTHLITSTTLFQAMNMTI